MINRNEIVSGAMGLPEPDRIRLVEELLRSLESVQVDPVWEVEVRAELDARIEDFEAGKSPARDDWRESMAELRKSLQSAKPS